MHVGGRSVQGGSYVYGLPFDFKEELEKRQVTKGALRRSWGHNYRSGKHLPLQNSLLEKIDLLI
jgi:hypothetical protein